MVDYPNSTKAKMHYLVLKFDRVYTYKAPVGLVDGSFMAQNNYVKVDRHAHGKGKRSGKDRGRRGEAR